eukprot:UN02577
MSIELFTSTPSGDSYPTFDLEDGIRQNEDSNEEYESDVKPSCIKSEANPLTIAREKKINDGQSLKVTFDERVEVRYLQCDGPISGKKKQKRLSLKKIFLLSIAKKRKTIINKQNTVSLGMIGVILLISLICI